MNNGTVKWFNEEKGFGLFQSMAAKMYLYISRQLLLTDAETWLKDNA